MPGKNWAISQKLRSIRSSMRSCWRKAHRKVTGVLSALWGNKLRPWGRCKNHLYHTLFISNQLPGLYSSGTLAHTLWQKNCEIPWIFLIDWVFFLFPIDRARLHPVEWSSVSLGAKIGQDRLGKTLLINWFNMEFHILLLTLDCDICSESVIMSYISTYINIRTLSSHKRC